MKAGDLPVFPAPGADSNGLDWFATFAPRPERALIESRMAMDRSRNPHNDS